MTNNAKCYNLSLDEDTKEFIRQAEIDFDAKYPNGNASQKQKYLLKQFKDQQTQAKQNLLDNASATKNLLALFERQQVNLKKQGFQKQPLSEFMKGYFFGTGKHYENATLTFETTTNTEINLRTGALGSDLIHELKDDFYNIINLDFTSEIGKKLNNDIRRELYRLNPRDNSSPNDLIPTNNDMAIRIANILNKHNAKNLIDMAALNIPFAKRLIENGRKGYDGYQTHDKAKLHPQDGTDEGTAQNKWIEIVKDLIIPSQAKLLANPDRAKVIFNKLLGKPTAQSADKNLLSFIRSVGDDIDTSIDLQRGLYFKDLESSLKYNELYGSNNSLITQANNQIRGFAIDINSKRQLGSNPYAVLNEINNKIKSESDFGKKQTNKFNQEELSIFYDTSIGKIEKGSTLIGNIRTYGSITRLGSTVWNTAGMDISVQKFKEREIHGINVFAELALAIPRGIINGFQGVGRAGKISGRALEGNLEYYGYLAKAPIRTAKDIISIATDTPIETRFEPKTKTKYGVTLEEQSFLLDNAVGWNAISNNMQKYWEADIKSKGVSWLSTKFSRVALFPQAKNLSDKGGLEIVASALGKSLKSSYSALKPDLKTYLAKIGIQESEFSVLRNIIPEVEINTKSPMIYPSSVRGLSNEQLKPLTNSATTKISKRKQTELSALKEIQRRDEELVTLKLDQRTKNKSGDKKVKELSDLDKRIKEIEGDYKQRREDIIDKYNKEEENVYSIVRQELENKLASASYDLNRRVQGEKTLKQRVVRYGLGSTYRQTGELEKSFLALKTPLINNYENIIQSVMYNPNLSKYGRYGTLIGFGASSIVVAMMAMLSRDIISGKEPKEITKGFIWDAFLYSNVNTLYTEIPNVMFGAYLGTSRNKEMSLLNDVVSFASPDLGAALKLGTGTILNTTKSVITKEKFNTDLFIQSIKSNAPLQNLWATRALTDMTFDYLSEWAGGQGLSKRNKSISNQKNILGNKRDYIEPISSLRN